MCVNEDRGSKPARQRKSTALLVRSLDHTVRCMIPNNNLSLTPGTSSTLEEERLSLELVTVVFKVSRFHDLYEPLLLSMLHTIMEYEGIGNGLCVVQRCR